MINGLEQWSLALAAMVLLATMFGLLIVWVSKKFKVEGNPIVHKRNVDNVITQVANPMLKPLPMVKHRSTNVLLAVKKVSKNWPNYWTLKPWN